MKKYLLLLLTLFFVGCGYKPSVHYAKEQVGERVFVDLYVSVIDPKNSVIIKDALSSLLVNKFGAKIVSNKNEADTLFYLRLNSVGMSVLQYDEQGFEKLYRATVNISIDYTSKNGSKNSITVSGVDDFTVDGEGEISEANRFNAISNAASRAFEEVVSKIAVQSFKKLPKDEEK